MRDRPHRRRRALHAGLGLVALVAACAGGLSLSRSSLFDARTIRVRGASHVSAAAVERLAGISRATNVVWLDAAEAVRRLERDPWIATARVERSLPAAITVLVTERTPVAVVASPSGYRLIAGDGTVLGAARRPAGLPVIGDANPPRATTTGVPDAVASARILGAMSGSLRHRISTVTADASGLVLTLRGGVPVTFGTATQVSQKARALSALLRWADARGVSPTTIDVSVPLSPTAGLPGGAVGTP